MIHTISQELFIALLVKVSDVYHIWSQNTWFAAPPPKTPFFSSDETPLTGATSWNFQVAPKFPETTGPFNTQPHLLPFLPPSKKESGIKHLQTFVFYLVPSPTRMVWRVREVRWATSRKRSCCKISSCAGSTLRICGRDTSVAARGVSWRWAVPMGIAGVEWTGDGSQSYQS